MYTSALLYNWIFDARKNAKVFLNLLDNSIMFFYTEKAQYIVDYEYDSCKIVIYFFNIQRKSSFHNYMLIQCGDNLFEQHEIKY